LRIFLQRTVFHHDLLLTTRFATVLARGSSK
jgi:hypothetical protein